MNDIELKMRLKSHSENIKNSIDSPFDITEKIDEMETENMTKKMYHLIGLRKPYTAQLRLRQPL